MWSFLQQIPLETSSGRAAAVGLAVVLAAYVTLVVQSFRISRPWGLLIMVFPFAALRKCFGNLDNDMRKAFILLLLGLALLAPFTLDHFRGEEETLVGPPPGAPDSLLPGMEILRQGSVLDVAVERRENLYGDLERGADDFATGASNSPTPPKPVIKHPDLPPDLDTLEEQFAYEQQLKAEQAALVQRQRTLVAGDTAALDALRRDAAAYNARAARHRKAVKAYREAVAQMKATQGAILPPAASGPVAIQR